MALQALLPFIPSIVSAVGTLLGGKDDPQAWQRQQMKDLIAKIQAEYPKMEAGLHTRESVQRGGLLRQIADMGAAGGMPRNVTQQQMTEGALGSRRLLGEQLDQLRREKVGTLQNVAGIAAAVPPEQSNTGMQDIFSTSLYDLLSSGKLTNLLSGQGQGQFAGFGNVGDYNKHITDTNQWAVPKSLPL